MRVFLTGASGQLGRALQRVLDHYEIIPAHRPEFDLASFDSVRDAIHRGRPNLVIHAGAYTDVDGCERDPDRAYQINCLGTQYVAVAAQAVGAELVAVSTDFIFDGTKPSPYVEYDDPNPLSAYGRSKLQGERAALTFHQRCYVVRPSWVFSPGHRNFVSSILRFARERPELNVVNDEVGSPTLAIDLARAITRLVQTGAYGIYHFSNEGSCSRHEFAERAIALAGLTTPVKPMTSAEYRERVPTTARRPSNSTLANVAGAALGIRLPHWEDALRRYLAEDGFPIASNG